MVPESLIKMLRENASLLEVIDHQSYHIYRLAKCTNFFETPCTKSWTYLLSPNPNFPRTVGPIEVTKYNTIHYVTLVILYSVLQCTINYT